MGDDGTVDLEIVSDMIEDICDSLDRLPDIGELRTAARADALLLRLSYRRLKQELESNAD